MWRSATTAAALTGKGRPRVAAQPGRRLERPAAARPHSHARLSRCGRPGAPRTDAQVQPMRAGRPESPANQRGAREEEAGARAARARPRQGALALHRPGRGGVAYRACTSDLGCRQGRRDAKAKPCPQALPQTWSQCCARLEVRSWLQRSEAQGALPPPQPGPRGPDTRPCRPAPPRGDAGTEKGAAVTDRSRHSTPTAAHTSHSNPGKMARQGGCGRGACVQGAE